MCCCHNVNRSKFSEAVCNTPTCNIFFQLFTALVMFHLKSSTVTTTSSDAPRLFICTLSPDACFCSQTHYRSFWLNPRQTYEDKFTHSAVPGTQWFGLWVLAAAVDRKTTLSEAVGLQEFITDDIYRWWGCRRSTALPGLKQVLPLERQIRK